ncbi:RNA helicase [Tepiditoga spiralis]|uniref:RNA helicase n=1 Tax=Tepiditoga spiralis TaxID=2108365 RepID=A0A7G1G1W5_9BACT|nr:DEAD/DEAH box helicase [Tepiditoga spiralis]BBE30270.1 RNA helicase [Tepiditoga spiralis]
MSKFEDLGLSETTLKALKKKGFEEPTPIQEKTIPVLLKGEVDLIGQAQTGTGKTAAFGLPLIEKLTPGAKHVQALILAPTRELAVQVAEEINSLKGRSKLSILPIYGGASIERQLNALRRGVDIVVGTPGRVIDHIKRKSLKLENISYFILDEADEMLNMGFIDDMEEIFKHTNPDKRVLLFSATMPKPILGLAKKYMKNFEIIKVKKEQLTTNLTDQIYFEVNESDKFEALCRIIDIEKDFYGLVFCRTKLDVDRVALKLTERGYNAEGIHGDISQYQRERILKKFKDKRAHILVATDVAARGLDINDLTHVINYSLPQDPESYVHRIGRTGRAGKEGTAITFVTPSEYRKLIFIKRVANTNIRKEKVPGIKEIIKTKKERIKNEILDIVKNSNASEYENLAKELLNISDPVQAISALLKHAYQSELDTANYNEISEVSINTKGKTRLFVALGKKDEMDIKKLLKFIKDKTDVDTKKIRDVRIFENFSFISVPFEEAEIIIDTFKRKKRGRRPLVEKAKERKSK